MRKSSAIFFIVVIVPFLASCGQRQQSVVPSVDADKVDSLSTRIQQLEEQNAAQDARIKDLEDDLEDVISFLNERGY